VRQLHEWWGYVTVGLLALGGVAHLAVAARRRALGRLARALAFASLAAVALQVTLGVVMLQTEGMRPGNQHVFYGVVISFTLAFAYIYRQQLERRPAIYRGLLLLFLMGLAIRGILTFGNNF